MTTKGFRFEPNEKGIHLAASTREVAGILTQYARDAARNIRRRAPKGRQFMDYRKSIRVEPARPGAPKIEAAVLVDSPTWHLPEYGTALLKPTAPIRNGVRDTRIRFEERH